MFPPCWHVLCFLSFLGRRIYASALLRMGSFHTTSEEGQDMLFLIVMVGAFELSECLVSLLIYKFRFEFRLRMIFPWLEARSWSCSYSLVHSFKAMLICFETFIPCGYFVFMFFFFETSVFRVGKLFRFLVLVEFSRNFPESLWYFHEWSYTVPSGGGAVSGTW